jgi:chromosome segregation ATPase
MTDEIQDRLARVESRLDSLSEVAVSNDGEIEELQREVAGLRQDYGERLRGVEEAIERLDHSLAFIEQTQAADASSREARVAVCIQTIVNKAEQNAGKATLDAAGVNDALGGDVNRASRYEVLKAIPEHCEAAEYIHEDRSSDRNCRVELRMDDGSVPSVVAGRRIEIGNEVLGE